MNSYKLIFLLLTFSILAFGFTDSTLGQILLITYYYRLGLSLLVGVLITGVATKRFKLHWLHWLFAVLILLMTYNGIRSSLFVYANFQPDLFLYLGIWCFLILGYNLKIRLILDWLYFLVLAGIFINVIGIMIEPTFLRSEVDFVNSIAYKYHALLFPSLTFILLPSYFSGRKYKVILIALGLVVLEIFLFQKRAYLARVSLILALTWVLFNFSSMYKYNAQVRKLKSMIILSFIFILPLFVYLGRGYISATFDRVTSSGSVKKTLENDARFEIGDELMSIATQNRQNLLFGVGMGSGVELESGGFRRHSEMGIPSMMFKGGISLLAFWSLIGIIVLFNIRKYLITEVATAFVVTVLIWYLFVYVEGYFSAYQNPMSYLIPFAMGVLLRVKQGRTIQLV